MIVKLKLASVRWAAKVLKNAGMKAADVAVFLVRVVGASLDATLDIIRGLFDLSLRDVVRMMVDLGLGSLEWALKILGGIF